MHTVINTEKMMITYVLYSQLHTKLLKYLRMKIFTDFVILSQKVKILMSKSLFKHTSIEMPLFTKKSLLNNKIWLNSKKFNPQNILAML